MRLRVTWFLFGLVFLCVGASLAFTPYVARATVQVPDYPACPARTQQLATITGRVYRDREPRQIEHLITVPGAATLTVLGFVEEGHPSECPGGRCNQGQLNEEFSVKLNGVEFGRYLDKGPYDQWFEAGPWFAEVMTSGEQSLQLAHLMTGRHNQPGSVTYRLSVCAASAATPIISVPDDIVVDAATAEGTRVNYSASAVDGFGAPLTVVCAPPSGALFPIGVTTVTCSATDSFGTSVSASFNVTVRATTGDPTIDVPDDIIAEAESASGTRVNYSASAVDGFGTPLTVTCNQPSGTIFPLGATTVECRARDSFGGTASASFTVTVRDTTPPLLLLPKSFTVMALSEEGAMVEYSVDASDLVDPLPLIDCAPPSSRVFDLGETLVVCEASDSFGNSALGSFTVTVVLDIVPPEILLVRLNDGAAESATREINLRFSAIDPEPGSGVSDYLVNEYIPDTELGIWTIVRSTSWQPTTGESTRSWTLTADPGAHYVQVLVRDRAGNISSRPGGAIINYVPASDSIKQGTTRIYRYRVQAGQHVDVRVTPLSGDADLLIFPPTYPALAGWRSENRSGEDRVSFIAPESGSYQIEVYGFTAATYSLDVTIGLATARADTSSVLVEPKAQRGPAFPPDALPGMPEPAQLQYHVHLPLLRGR
ncbi:HYR domain-containing protein [Candidatus Gracilibacteria bacterium]|nr:HYR domain-containing protein [Candidatus Gracilibacteria bacterium]